MHIVSGNPSNAEGTSVRLAGSNRNERRPHLAVTDTRLPLVTPDTSPVGDSQIFESGVAPWAAWRSYAFGYCHLNVVNETALYVDIISTSLGGAVVDDVWITKDRPCSFGTGCHATESPARSWSSSDSGVARPLRHMNLNGKALVAQRRSRRRATAADQLAALWSLFESLGGPGWRRSDGWRKGGDPCRDPVPWYGVACEAVTDITMPDLYDPRIGGVSALQLPGNGLRGNVSAVDLGPLLRANLQLLDLSDNFLYGPLPGSVFVEGGPKLHTLHLDSRTDGSAQAEFKLTGSLPENVGTALPNLKSLALQRHTLTGSLPASMGAFDCSTTYTAPNEQACRFWMRDNGLSGAPPMQLCNNTFDELYLMGNDFTCGAMPCFHCAYCSKGTEQVTPCEKKCRPCS